MKTMNAAEKRTRSRYRDVPVLIGRAASLSAFGVVADIPMSIPTVTSFRPFATTGITF